MAQLYWDKTISNRLIMHENNGRPGSSLIMDLFPDNIISIYQDSDIPIVRNKFEAMDESVEFDLDDYIFLLKSQINLLEDGRRMKLYELTENYNQVLEMAEQLDAETLTDTLDSIDEAIEIKVENTAKVVRSLEGNVDAIESEIKRLTAKKSTLNNNIKGIKSYMQESMEQVGKDKIKGQLFNIGIQNNPQGVNIIDENKINLDYFIEQSSKLDKKLLLADLKEGKKVEGAEIQQTRSLRIR